MTLFKKRISKALISLHGCAGWSAPLLFANHEDRFSCVEAHIHVFLWSSFSSMYYGVGWFMVRNTKLYVICKSCLFISWVKVFRIILNSGFWGWLSIESQPQNTELAYYNSITDYIPRRRRGGGHIVFGADSVSISICMALACVQDISWTSGWIGTRLTLWHDADWIRFLVTLP